MAKLVQIKNWNVNKVAWPGGVPPHAPTAGGSPRRGLAVKQRLSNKQAQRNNTFFCFYNISPCANSPDRRC